MSLVKNPILSTLQRMVGISPSPQPVVLDDANISLTLPLVPHVTRRSLAGIESGWFLGITENVHSGADAESSFIDPYNPGDLAVAPYPGVVPDDFDVWVLGVAGVRSSGVGDLTGAIFSLNPADTSQGWGIDDAGAAVIGSLAIKIAFFDTLEETVTAVVSSAMLTEAGLTYQPVGIRVPRGGLLGFDTESVAAAEFQGQWLIGLFPAGLGQDVVT